MIESALALVGDIGDGFDQPALASVTAAIVMSMVGVGWIAKTFSANSTLNVKKPIENTGEAFVVVVFKISPWISDRGTSAPA